MDLTEQLDSVATDTRFSGVVRADVDGSVEVERAYGRADRAHEIPNAVDTQFAIASGTKGLTAVMVVALIDAGSLELATTARSILGSDLPLIDDDVTVEQLLAHRSGIGDYFAEDDDWDVNDYVLPIPVHELANAEDYLRVLDGFPTAFAPGERFSYCNGGYVVLGLLAERAAGVPYHELVDRYVCAPAGMQDTAFLRSDELPGGAAIGYLDADGLRTNVLHLPVRGVGDGGAYTTAADVHSFWTALLAGGILPERWVQEMVRPRSDVPESMRYGLGFWLRRSGDAIILMGDDPGISFCTVHDPSPRLTYTVLSNVSNGAGPMATCVRDLLSTY